MSKQSNNKCSFLKHVVPYIVAIASAIAAVTPSNSPDPIIRTIKIITTILSLNGQHAPQIEECQLK